MSAIEVAGAILAGWVEREIYVRRSWARPFFVEMGVIRGELLFWDPPPGASDRRPPVDMSLN